MSGVRLTAQARLTFAYGGLFLITGAALTVLIIALTFPPRPDSSTRGQVGTKASLPAKAAEAAQSEAVRAAEAQAMRVKEQARRELRTRLIGVSAIALCGMTIVAVGLGWAMAGRVLRPVHAVSGTARRCPSATCTSASRSPARMTRCGNWPRRSTTC
jgi:hypothetical protein